MTLLNFPPTNGAPTDGSFTYVANGVIYSWDGEKWIANSEQSFEDTYVNIDGDTMTGDLTVPNLISEGDVQATSFNGGPLGLRNQLINGDMQIWQRGSSGGPIMAGGAYLCDRFFGSSSIDSWTRCPSAGFAPGIEYGLRFSGSANCYVLQPIELMRPGHPNQFAVGTQWTFSFYADSADTSVDAFFSDQAAPAGGVIVLDPAIPTSLGGNRYSVTFTINEVPAATNTCLNIRLKNTSGSQLETAGWQVETGPVATPVEHRPIALELSLCQRYFYRLNHPTTTAVITAPFTLHQTSGGNARGSFIPPTTLRTTPTVSTGGHISTFTIAGNGNSQTVTSIYAGPNSGKVIGIYVEMTGGTNIGNYQMCGVRFGADGKCIDFDAEL